ncbi:hypothetical protein KSP39_PZI002845 [Platanthera zijinensis]|uniref:Uncharacterized protein n=1 Tax=Platanthera zijinensis TaxID=2320716 RepID=A0AAP0BYY5_9ASPA
MDPLSALRDFTVRGELDNITLVGDEFRFADDYSFPCSTETAFRSKQGNLYTLETLLFFVRHHHLKHTEYLQSARFRRVPAVTLPDRKPLLDYLQGRIASSDSIELLPPTAMTAVGQSIASFPSYTVAGARGEGIAPDIVDYVSLIRALERPLKDRESLLECRNRDFYSVLMASTRREEERHRIESQQRKDGLVAKTRLFGSDDRGDEPGGYETPKPKMHLKGTKIGDGVPIILVPSAFQTLITIYNVKEFLEDGVFVSTDVKVKAMNGSSKPVRDKPSALKPEDWDRVVAVFVLGKEWQFKDWPFKDHVEIFNKS